MSPNGKTEEEIKALLGDDFEAFVAFKTARDKKAKQAQAKQLATAMVSDGGKYYDSYNRLNEQLDAIWEKALTESKKQVGITEEEEAS